MTAVVAQQWAKVKQTGKPLFAPIKATDLAIQYPTLRPRIVEGLLREGETMNLVAPPKVGKTWIAHALAVAVGNGVPWMGMESRGGRVLIIDAELHHETLADRMRRAGAGATVETWPVRGQGIDIHTAATALADVKPGTYRLIVLDALYRFMPHGQNENTNETMTMVYNQLDLLAERLRAAVVAVHHSTKGLQSEKAVTDVGAGGGAQSRAADTHLVLREHEEEDALVVDAAVRSWPRLEPFCVRWCNPGWERVDELDPARLKQRKSGGRGPEEEVPDNILERFVSECLRANPRPRGEILEEAERIAGSGRQAKLLLKQAEEKGFAHRWEPKQRNRPVCYANVPQFNLPY